MMKQGEPPMKRTATLLLALALVFLFACGRAAPEEPGTTADALTTTEAPTATEAPETEPIPDPADNEPTDALLERYAAEIINSLDEDGQLPRSDEMDEYGVFPSILYLSKHKTVIGTAMGDLNRDGKDDLAVTVNLALEEDTRETYVLLAEGGKYKVRHMNRGLVRGPLEGGISGDPFAGLTIENGTLTVSLCGGSAWWWKHDYHFRYSSGKLLLVKTDVNHHWESGGTETICDYIRGTYESYGSINMDYPESPRLLLHKSTFSAVKSTFEAPLIDDATYAEGLSNAPSIRGNWYQEPPPMDPLISAEEALDIVQKAYYSNMKKVTLPWTDEGRASYKKMLGYDMPSWYYASEKGRLTYYNLDGDPGQLAHSIMYEPFDADEAAAIGSSKFYGINDATGEIN